MCMNCGGRIAEMSSGEDERTYGTWTVDSRAKGKRRKDGGRRRDRDEREREKGDAVCGRECRDEIGKDGWLYTEEIYDSEREGKGGKSRRAREGTTGGEEREEIGSFTRRTNRTNGSLP